MNSGAHIPSFIEQLTGISNAMVRSAPKVGAVMNEVAEFVGDYPLVAHNAAFDRKFWDAELLRLQRRRGQEFICSLLLARRIYPEAPSHKLAALANHLHLPGAARYHRALADAQVTAHLILDIKEQLQRRYRLRQVTSGLLLSIQKQPKSNLELNIKKYATAQLQQ
jgi:DNA polymerase-3 subunit epsilon